MATRKEYQEEIFACRKSPCAIAGGYLNQSQIESLCYVLRSSDPPEYVSNAFEHHAGNLLQYIGLTDPKAKEFFHRLLENLEDRGDLTFSN